MARQSDLYPLLDKYADGLSAKLGRSAEEVREKGLFATDFQDDLEVVFMDGSTATFKFAVCVESPDQREVALFTEHCGYIEFGAYDLQIYAVERRQVFASRYPEYHDPED